MGCLLGLDTWFSQAAGARDDKSLHRYFSQSMWSSVIMTVLSLAGVVIGTFFYMRIAAPSPTRDAFFSYITMVSWVYPHALLPFCHPALLAGAPHGGPVCRDRCGRQRS